jgi:hypothetical protein
MILRIRLFLIFTLMLLQFAAPLLHAHKNSAANFGISIHLPEFEQVNTLLKHAPELAAPTNHDGEIIAVSAGIKNETLQLLQTENTLFVLLVSVFLLANIKRSSLCYSSKTEPIPDGHFFNSALPRAPPFFTFR